MEDLLSKFEPSGFVKDYTRRRLQQNSHLEAGPAEARFYRPPAEARFYRPEEERQCVAERAAAVPGSNRRLAGTVRKGDVSKKRR